MVKNPHSGKFIVFEGLDGSGQTTQAGLLKDLLQKHGFEVVLTKEPTMDSEAGKIIRRVLDKEITLNPLELQKHFTQDRKEHLENLIIPALKEGKIVISDRYFFSTFAFGASTGLDLKELISLNSEFLLPDLTLILKVSPKICVERIAKRGEGVKLFEKEEKLTRVWKTYRIMPGLFENVYLIDGEKEIEGVFKQVQALVHSELNLF